MGVCAPALTEKAAYIAALLLVVVVVVVVGSGL
jgi:hypothetical protein